jgi:hypothetical protein
MVRQPIGINMQHTVKYRLKGYYWGMNEQQMRQLSTVIVLVHGDKEYEIGNKEDVEKLIKLLQKVQI